MIISKTPLRMSFFGGGTDYPEWFSQHGGAVLSATFNKYCYITCRYLPPFFDHKYRLSYSKVEHQKSIQDIEHKVIKQVIVRSEISDGLEIHCDADLPARSRLGSSSTFTVGLINALYNLLGRQLPPSDLAQEAIFIERERLSEVVGYQDQHAAAHGGLNLIEFAKSGQTTINRLPVEASRQALLADHLMLFFTGISRDAHEIAAKKVQGFNDKKSELRLMQASVAHAANILTNGGNISEFGELMHMNWMLKKSLSDCISNSYLDSLYDAARQSGAIGGKLIGAGGGGFLLMFVPPKRQQAVKVALSELVHVPFRFEDNGSEIIYTGGREPQIEDLPGKEVA